MIENVQKIKEFQDGSGGLLDPAAFAGQVNQPAHQPPGDSSIEKSRWCNTKAWLVADTEKIVVREFNCGSWGCEKCVGKLRWKWAKIIAWGVARISRLRFLTLTKFPRDSKQASIAYNNLNRDLRAAGYSFDYFGFNEISPGGMRHKHILLRGDYIPQELISKRAKANGLGSVVWIEQVNDSQKAYEYVTKYIGKNPDSWSGRKFSYSKNFFFGRKTRDIWLEFLATLFPVSPDRTVILLDLYETTTPETVYDFDTVLDWYKAQKSLDIIREKKGLRLIHASPGTLPF